MGDELTVSDSCSFNYAARHIFSKGKKFPEIARIVKLHLRIKILYCTICYVNIIITNLS